MTRRPNALELRHPLFPPPLATHWPLFCRMDGHRNHAGKPVWALLIAGIGAYATYVFFFDFELHDDGSIESQLVSFQMPNLLRKPTNTWQGTQHYARNGKMGLCRLWPVSPESR